MLKIFRVISHFFCDAFCEMAGKHTPLNKARSMLTTDINCNLQKDSTLQEKYCHAINFLRKTAFSHLRMKDESDEVKVEPCYPMNITDKFCLSTTD